MIPFPFLLFEEQRQEPSFLSLSHTPLNCRSGKLAATFRSQPAEQPTSGSLVIQEVGVPDSANLDLLVEGLSSQEEHSQQGWWEVGSKLGAGKWSE